MKYKLALYIFFVQQHIWAPRDPVVSDTMLPYDHQEAEKIASNILNLNTDPPGFARVSEDEVLAAVARESCPSDTYTDEVIDLRYHENFSDSDSDSHANKRVHVKEAEQEINVLLKEFLEQYPTRRIPSLQDPVWVCGFCKKKYKGTSASVKTHIENEHLGIVHVCPRKECRMTFTQKSTLARHMRRRHGSRIKSR